MSFFELEDHKDFVHWIIYLKDSMFEFFAGYSNLELYPAVILITAIIFIVLHRLRHVSKLCAQLSILLGFFPVLIHEMGHAVTAFMTGGKVEHIHMNLTQRSQDHTQAQGYAKIKNGNGLSQVLTAFMGYATPILVFYFGVKWIEEGFGALFILCLILMMCFYATHTRQIWIPVLFVFFFGFTEVGMNMTESALAITPMSILYSAFLGLLLGEIIQSLFIMSRLVFKDQVWDGYELAKLTYVPKFVWVGIYGVISYFAIKHAIEICYPELFLDPSRAGYNYEGENY